MNNINSSNTNINNTDYSNPDFNKRQSKFGAFQNVVLSEYDVKELQNILNYQLDKYIERLSSYFQSTGKTYQDHKATILSWFYKDQGNKKDSNIPAWEDYDKEEHL